MRKALKITSLGLAGLAGMVGLGAAVGIAARNAEAPENLGVRDGRLAPCSIAPNCASSQAQPDDRLHYVAPLRLTQEPDEVQAKIRAMLAAEQNVEVLRDDPGYIHAVFRSATMGIPDDVEFYLDERAGLLHFRSAVRLGQYDMGVNRRRLKRLRATLEQNLVTP